MAHLSSRQCLMCCCLARILSASQHTVPPCLLPRSSPAPRTTLLKPTAVPPPSIATAAPHARQRTPQRGPSANATPHAKPRRTRAQILKEILENKEEMGDTMKASFFSMTEAKYAAGDNVKHTIFDNVETAQARPRPRFFSCDISCCKRLVVLAIAAG